MSLGGDGHDDTAHFAFCRQLQNGSDPVARQSHSCLMAQPQKHDDMMILDFSHLILLCQFFRRNQNINYSTVISCLTIII